MQITNLNDHSMAPREVEFAGGTGVLKGFLFTPPGEGPFPCVIDNHGSATPPGTTDLSHPQTAALFLSWGCAYLFPHRAGYGNSLGIVVGDEVPAPRGTVEHDDQMSARLICENKDVIAALDYAAGLEEIDAERMIVMGVPLVESTHYSRWRLIGAGAGGWIFRVVQGSGRSTRR